MGEHSAPDDSADVPTTADPAWLVRLRVIFTPERRRKLYALIVLLAPLLAARNLVSDDDLTTWLNVAYLILVGGGGTVAVANTPKAPR